MEALLLLTALAAAVAVLALVGVPALRARQAGVRPGQTALDPSAGYGFVPPAALDPRLPGPDQELLDALTETQRTQDYHPVARLLAFTGDDWELRWQRVQSLAGAAARELADARRLGSPTADGAGVSFVKGPHAGGASWLREWRAGRPDDAGGAQVYAQFLLWQALADPDSADHRIILEEARTLSREAAALAPADPTPHLTDLVIGRHLGDRRADYESLFQTVLRLAPHHMGAHLAALPYWSEEGQGSREEAYAFAKTAAANAPEGTLLPALPLFAVYAHLPDVPLVRGLYRSAEVEQAVEAAEFAVDHAPGDHPVRPHVLHLLVCFLVRAERYEEALGALRAVDGWIGALPWAESSNPAAMYASYRALAVAGWESTGGARAPKDQRG